MRLRSCLMTVGIALTLATPTVATADKPKTATIVYDVSLREFTCWSEESVTIFPDSPCGTPGWHRLTPAFHLKRGQAIQLLLVNARALDLYAAEIKADDLAEPTLAAIGGLSELPKLQPLAPGRLLIPGVGAVLASAPTGSLSELHRYLVASDAKSFTSWVDGLLSRFDAKEVREFLTQGGAVLEAVNSMPATKPWEDAIKLLDDAVKKIADGPASNSSGVLLKRLRALASSLDQLAWVRAQVAASLIPAASSTLSASAKSSNSVVVQTALAIPPQFFSDLANSAGPWGAITKGCWFASVTSLSRTPTDGLRSDAVPGCGPVAPEFLTALTAAAGGSISAAGLTQLQGNLNLLGERRTRLEAAEADREALEDIKGNITSGAERLRPLRSAADALTERVLTTASLLNAEAASLPLDHDLRILPIGTWYATKTITVTVKQGRRGAIFDAPQTTDAASVSLDATTQPTKGGLTGVADLASTRSFQFPVYNMYRFQLGLGTAYSSSNDRRYQINTVTTGSGSSQVVEKFIEESVSRHYNVLWTANLIFYPTGRHAFPNHPRYDGESPGGRLRDLGLMLGFSVTEPARNVMVGAVWMPRGSVAGLQAAYHLAMRDVPNGDFEAALSGRLTTFRRKPFHGFSVGLVLSSDAFGKFLAPIFKP